MCKQGNCCREGVSVGETLTGVRADLWGGHKPTTYDLRVDAAAKVMWQQEGNLPIVAWEELPEYVRVYRRNEARAVLAAADAVEAVSAAADQKGTKVPTQ